MKLKGSQYVKNFDWIIICIISALVVISLLMMANASFNPFADTRNNGIVGFLSTIDFYYVFLQGAWYLIGLIAMTFIMFVDYEVLAKYGKLMYIINLTVLLALLILGKSTRGIKGWIKFGSRGFQPSELCKITIIIFIGRLIANKIEEKGSMALNFYDILPIVSYFVIPLIFVALQPDFGTAMVYVVSFLGMLFMAKIDKKVILIGVISLAIIIPVGWFLLDDWQRLRVTGMFTGQNSDQVNASKLLIGSGGMFGKGFFKEGTLASLDFMAEKHTDFIFAFVVETMGLVGGLIVIFLYIGLLIRLIYLAKNTNHVYGKIIIMGVMSMFMAHIFENIAMTMGVMPVTGIPAPFLSYGGSNMLTNMLAIGLVECVLIRRGEKYF